MNRGQTNQRAVYGEDLGQSFTLVTRPRDELSPSANEVLVANKATGLNHIDLLALGGQMPPALQPSAPFIAGVEGAGIVAAVGEDVTHVRPGDRVMWFGDLGVGGLSSHVVIGAHQVARVPTSITLEQAAALPVAYTTALHMLTNLGRVTSGDQILIHAAGGGVGLALVELATASGLEVVATDEASKRDAIMGAGARAFVDYRVDDLTAVVRDVTRGEGVALSINPVGGASLARDFELLAPFGEVILYGFLDGVPEATIAEALVPHFSESVALRVSDIYTLSRANPARFQETLERVIAFASNGSIKPRITRFGDAAEALEAMQTKAHVGKLIVGEGAWMR